MTRPLVAFPWFDRVEVRNVFDELYSDKVSQQKHALDRISVWESRALNRLPMAVDSTAALVKANIEYTKSSHPVGNCHRLRELYSMAVIRFVNIFTERNQQKAHALPVHLAASYLGVPNWIVDLRHDATHAALPSLTELRAATQWCLDWLKTEFWEVQCQDTFKATEIKTGHVDKLRDMLVTYMQSKFQDIMDDSSSTSKALISKIEDTISEMGSEACQVLLEDGYFILTEGQLQSINVERNSILQTDQCLLPLEMLQFWRPVIFILQRYDLISVLLLQILTNLSSTKSLRNALLSKWFFTLLDCSDSQKSNKKKLLILNATDVPYKALLAKCLFQENCFLQSSVSMLIDNGNLSLEQKQNLKELVFIYHSVNEIETPKAETGNINPCLLESSITTKSSSPWRRCTASIDWSQVPLGLLPDQVITYTSLELGGLETASMHYLQTETVSFEVDEENEIIDEITEGNVEVMETEEDMSADSLCWTDQICSNITRDIVLL
ncbi:uncharacterized protein LOC128214479 [Mya arenaria]|uniref:uncharacterized protein LOC128214479 n=1 Tax=Mya arenaria TaxID=6604 RepID=UPI0022E0E251|nr:uncharacterized protein LOC128214479 [Mya arenaria]